MNLRKSLRILADRFSVAEKKNPDFEQGRQDLPKPDTLTKGDTP